MPPLRVGLAGFGTVGRSLAMLLRDHAAILERRAGRPIVLAAIAEPDARKRREARRFGRAVSDARSLACDPGIDVLVELVGGLEPAGSILLSALEHGKDVVTANKLLLATRGPEIVRAAARARRSVGFEASVCGGTPVIAVIRTGLSAGRIEEIAGIVNGTTNLLLQRMEGGLSAEAAIAEAQEEGIVERDPANDIDGLDAAHKLAILATLAFGAPFPLDAVDRAGIRNLPLSILLTARKRSLAVRLLASARMTPKGLQLCVRPTLLPSSHPFANLPGVQNALRIRGVPLGEQMLLGPGAGGPATAGAVAADLVDVATGESRPAFGRIARAAQGVGPALLGPKAGQALPHLVFGGGRRAAEVLKSLDLSVQPDEGLLRTAPRPSAVVAGIIEQAATTLGPLWALPLADMR